MSEVKTDSPDSRDQQLAARIQGMKDEISNIERACRSLTGAVKNKNPDLAKDIEAENALLKARVEKLQKVLHGLLADAIKCRSLDESNQHFEALRALSLRFFKSAEINSDIWKSIES
ncbi:MAG: hypothetical protein AB7P04_10960 [Bacteriovoracia bacterium]